MVSDTTSRRVRSAVCTQYLGTKVRTTRCSDADRERGVTSPDGYMTPPPLLNSVAYLRVSTEEQAESGLGLDAQRASVTAAATRLGLGVRAVHVDAGVSGSLSITARPVLLDAVLSLRRGDVLLVAKRDRLGRNMIEVAMIERAIAARGARIVSAAGEGSDTDEPHNWMLRRMVDMFAEYERLLTVARTKAALAAKRARGERAGQLPLGFQLAEDREHLEPAPVEQRLVARMRTLQAAGWSYRAIAAALCAEGWTTRRGTPMRFQYVARALRSA